MVRLRTSDSVNRGSNPRRASSLRLALRDLGAAHAAPMKIIGSFVSPYVRKVLACLELKGLDYEVDPITPFFGNDEFERLSPLRRIPVLIDGELVLTDSSVICEYLDETYTGHALLPSAPGTAPGPAGWRNMPTPGSATCSSGGCSTRRWSIPGCGASRAIWTRSSRAWPRISRRRSTISEGELPADGYLFGTIGLADIAIASFFRNAAYAGFDGRCRALAEGRALRRRHARPPGVRKIAGARAGPARRDIAGRRQALIDAGAQADRGDLGTRANRAEGSCAFRLRPGCRRSNVRCRVFSERRDGMKPCSGSSYSSPGAS